MRRADRRDSNYDNAINNVRSSKKEPTPPRELEQLLMTVRAQRDEAKAKATELVTERDQWQQHAKLQEEAAIQAQQELKTYQVEVDKLQERVTQMYQTYLNEQKSYQQALSLYNQEKTKATQLVVQRDEWQQRALINQEAASQLVLVRQDIQTYQVEINDLKASVAQYYQSYRSGAKKLSASFTAL